MALKLKTQMSNVSIINNNVEKLALRFILWSFLALTILYVILLGNMVSNIVARRNLEASARSLSNEVGDLELSYLSMSNNIDLNYSYSLGFKDTKATFATRKSVGLRPVASNGI